MRNRKRLSAYAVCRMNDRGPKQNQGRLEVHLVVDGVREVGGEGVLGTHPDIVREPLRHGLVIRCGVREGLTREPLALREGGTAECERLDHLRISGRGCHDRDVRVVLRGGAHERRSADVDLLDHVIRRRPRHSRLDEGIEVRHHELERLDAQCGEFGLVCFEPEVGEQAGVDRGVQRAHPPVERLGEAGDGGDLGDGEPGIRDRLRCRPG
jgi:hypothetical protein